ncbi:MAG TPA: polysaccharide biosynthesis C-terminal domain-containing protein [Chitinophagaceae bacterium]|nr:polysaccharide biosynthesis C-terminal domain-containing protein [Chitinophagaceae bacterium]
MRLQKLIYQGIVWRGMYYASVFALNIVIARVYKAADSGLINYLINNLSFLLLVTSFSLESALGYFGSRDEIKAGRLTALSLLFALGSALASTLAMLLFIEREPVHTNLNVLLLSFVYVLGFVLNNYFSALFYARQKVVLPNIVFIVINLLVLVYSIYGDKTSFLLVYFVSFLAQGMLLFVAWCAESGALSEMRLPSPADLRKLLNYAFTALVANLIFFLVYRVDYWFVKSFADDAALGNYIQVSKLGQIFLLLPSIIATAVFTRTARGNQEQVKHVIEIISRWLLVMYVLVVLAIAVTGKWLFPAIYGQSFNQMYGPFLLLSPGIVSLSMLALITAFNAGKHRININIKGSVIALLVIVAGNLVFVPRYGIYAAALVSSVGYICFQVYVLAHFKKEYRSGVLAFFVPRMSDWQKVKQFVRGNEAN